MNRYEDINVSILTVEPLGITDTMNNYCGSIVYRADAPLFIKLINSALKRDLRNDNKAIASQSNFEINTKQRNNVKSQIKGKLFVLRERWLECAYYINAIKKIKKSDTHFDVIISTYNTEFGHKVGLWYKKHHPEVKWITDYRDPLCGAYSNLKQRKHGEEFVKRVSKNCDIITVVAHGIYDIHRQEFNNKPVYVIPNGYDPEDSVPAGNRSYNNIVRIVYTGELYNGKRDLTPLFRAIDELVHQNKIDIDDIEIVYAGKSANVFSSQISHFPQIKNNCLGFVSREKALELQSSADLLLLASWCEPNDKEVLTGKFFEYLQMKKNIICLISGSATDCALTRIINEHTLGCCFEAAGGEADLHMLCEYLEKQVLTKKKTGFIDFVGDNEYVKRFNYIEITDELYKIIHELYK